MRFKRDTEISCWGYGVYKKSHEWLRTDRQQHGRGSEESLGPPDKQYDAGSDERKSGPTRRETETERETGTERNRGEERELYLSENESSFISQACNQVL